MSYLSCTRNWLRKLERHMLFSIVCLSPLKLWRRVSCAHSLPRVSEAPEHASTGIHVLQKRQPAKQLFPMECKILSVWTEKEFYGRAQLQLTTLVRFWAFRFIGNFFQFRRKTSFSSFPTKIRPNGFFFTIGRICSYSRNVLIWGSTLPIDICERVSRSVWFHLVRTAARFVKYSPSKISSEQDFFWKFYISIKLSSR